MRRYFFELRQEEELILFVIDLFFSIRFFKLFTSKLISGFREVIDLWFEFLFIGKSILLNSPEFGKWMSFFLCDEKIDSFLISV